MLRFQVVCHMIMDMSENVKKVANVSLKSQVLLKHIQASPVPILHNVPTTFKDTGIILNIPH